ncbi:MAG: HlyD family efflux transporter periplasmic adaptor subunit [Eubacterium sp.]|nr:HlyD family efflux transporter periplasmic adaptor subunit [Eubacterium sp.]
MNKKKKIWPWIVLIVVFTIIMILDIIAWAVTSKMSKRFTPGDFGNMPDMSNFDSSNMPDFDSSNMPDFDSSNMPDFGNGERPDNMPDMSNFNPDDMPNFSDGERPDNMPDFDSSNMPDMSNFDPDNMPQRPDRDRSDSDSSDSSDSDSSSSSRRPDNFPGTRSRGPFGTLKKIFLPVLIVCILVDIFAIIMLILAIKHNKNGSDGPEDGAPTGGGGDETAHEETGSKNIKGMVAKIAIPVALVLTVVTLAVLTKKKENETVGIVADESIMEASLSEASMSSVITAGGSISTEESEIDSYPDGIEVTKYYVEAGDTVSEGDVVADVDKVSVMSTIKTVQDTIAAIDKKLESISDDETEVITAAADGRIKKIYTEEGKAVKDTVMENGALMLISIDGCMAVDIEASSDLNIGDTVDVEVGEETVSGRITSLKEDIATITIDDEYGECDETVTVSKDEKKIGTGTLYIHQALAVTGYEGTVKSIVKEEGAEVSKGASLIKLQDGYYSAKYEQLLRERSKLEEQMKSLFELYQTGSICAKQSGEVTAINTSFENVNSVGGVKAVQLSNSPTGEDDSGYVNFAMLITGVTDSELQVKMSAAMGEIDFTTVGSISSSICTDAGSISKGSIGSVYGYTGSAWVAQTVSDIVTGEVVIASFDGSGNLIWIVRSTATAPAPTTEETTEATTESTTEATTEATTEMVPPQQPSSEQPTTEQGKEPTTEQGKQPDNNFPSGQDPTNPNGNSGNGNSGNGNNNGSGSNSGFGSGNSGFGSFPSSGSSGYSGSAALPSTEEEEEVYAVADVGIISISPKNTVDVDVSIDELDISKISIGKECEVTFDAISGQSFDGKVSAIDTSGVNEGGNTKYTVTVTMDRNEDMLSGMNTHVVFKGEDSKTAMVIPESALYEIGDKTFVYTGYDAAQDELTGLTEVTTGLADGENVEILSGIGETDTVYYRYADSLTFSF